MQYSNVEKLTSKYYKKDPQKTFAYGTAGFRTIADDLDTVMFRMGLLAVLRSKYMRAHIGLMITASHNPECDNGVKLVDPAGEMLAQNWEGYATLLANSADDELVAALNKIVAVENIDASYPAGVVVGRDTRASSGRLHQASVRGVEGLGGAVVECGVCTTPVLHYRVRTANDGGAYGPPTTEGYTNKLVTAFAALQGEGGGDRYTPMLFFDGANGVGGAQIRQMVDRLAPYLTLRLYNCGSDGVLNHLCGADYVKTGKAWPAGVPREAGVRCASMDGDADRIMYSYLDEQGSFHMLDGDKIAVLVASFFKAVLAKTGLGLSLGLVQTAYANGASTDYINGRLGVPVTCTKTGVKFLHHAAEGYDIGVYFEANGHGTVTMSDKAVAAIKQSAAKGCVESKRLQHVCDVINTTVGDAISDMLLVEFVLRHYDWTVTQWEEQYQDLPNRLVKVKVADRSIISTSNAERTCDTPACVQPAIDKLVAGYDRARAFIRPSGTEDVVRVYAEANTQQQTDALALQLAQLVHDTCAGVGPRPL